MENMCAVIEDAGIQVVDESVQEQNLYEQLIKEISMDDPVKMYLKDIGKVPLLSAEDEIKLAKQIISKDSKNYLAHYYLGKAYIQENKSELAIIEYKMVDENALFGTELNETDFRKEYSALLLKHKHQNEALKNFLLLLLVSTLNVLKSFSFTISSKFCFIIS